MQAARLIAFAMAACITMPAQTKAIFYMTSRPDSVQSFLAHADKIDILIPEVYSADEQGLVWGEPPPEVMEAAQRHRVPVMPIIVNPGFKQETIHALLAKPEAHARMAQALQCRRYGYYGIQFDFENIAFGDRDALTALLRETVRVFGPEGYKLSIATVHKSSEYPGGGDYAAWLYNNWRGAYDLAAIAKFVEFISVMAYDQHTGHTTPGPVAGFPWVEECLEYSLKVVPRAKVSLGIPLYGRRWYAGMRDKEARMLIASVNAPEAVDLAAQMKVTPQWDAIERAPWVHFYRGGVREYVFYNDARSFRECYELARKNGLHSFSSWVLGAEDPAIWSGLPDAKRK